MISDKMFKTIVSCTTTPILIAQPVFADKNIITDFAVIYVNEACKKLTSITEESNSTFSKSLTSLSPSINWTKFGTEALTEKKNLKHHFYSPKANMWICVSFSYIDDKHLKLTFLNITESKEHEQILRRQNMSLTALSEELAESKQALKNKLEKIEQLNRKLEHLAYYDALTGLPNRDRITTDLEEAINTAKMKDKKFGLMVIDIDDLKTVNDSRGHNYGDDILKETGRILKEFERENIHPYRFGGDEFIVVVNPIESKNSMVTIADTILEALNAKKIFVSAGISFFPDDTDQSAELLRYADMAMYEVKKQGKNNVFFFQQLMQEKFLAQLGLETKLSNAINSDSFQLFYQPQVDITKKELRGFEALLRWHDDELGWISPEKFIPLAEESREIIPLGAWILNAACETLAEWKAKFNFDGIMSVNVSPVQLKHPTFLFDLNSVINKYNINPKNLEIEVTEGVVIDNIEDTVNILSHIKNMGIGVSLDDFGTGYSSLSYLQILPLTTLKIDKSFIANITSRNSIEAEITDAIISLVTKMGLDTIAEGVENKNQLEVLKQIKCRNMQGFLTGKPMSKDDCEKMLSGDYSVIQKNGEDDI